MTTQSNRTGRKRGNNEGTIVQRADGRWAAAVTLPSGKRNGCTPRRAPTCSGS